MRHLFRIFLITLTLLIPRLVIGQTPQLRLQLFEGASQAPASFYNIQAGKEYIVLSYFTNTPLIEPDNELRFIGLNDTGKTGCGWSAIVNPGFPGGIPTNPACDTVITRESDIGQARTFKVKWMTVGRNDLLVRQSYGTGPSDYMSLTQGAQIYGMAQPTQVPATTVPTEVPTGTIPASIGLDCACDCVTK